MRSRRALYIVCPMALYPKTWHWLHVQREAQVTAFVREHILLSQSRRFSLSKWVGMMTAGFLCSASSGPVSTSMARDERRRSKGDGHSIEVVIEPATRSPPPQSRPEANLWSKKSVYEHPLNKQRISMRNFLHRHILNFTTI